MKWTSENGVAHVMAAPFHGVKLIADGLVVRFRRRLWMKKGNLNIGMNWMNCLDDCLEGSFYLWYLIYSNYLTHLSLPLNSLTFHAILFTFHSISLCVLTRYFTCCMQHFVICKEFTFSDTIQINIGEVNYLVFTHSFIICFNLPTLPTSLWYMLLLFVAWFCGSPLQGVR
jgi:hypothetical protein